MNSFKYISISLVLFMLSCGGGATSNVKKETTEVRVENVNITTFNIADSLIGKEIGSRSMGNAKSGEVLEDRFAIRNNSTKPLVIFEAQSNCGCLQVTYAKEPIKVGEAKEMIYTYDSKGKVGQQFSTINIKSNVGNFSVLVDLFLE